MDPTSALQLERDEALLFRIYVGTSFISRGQSVTHLIEQLLTLIRRRQGQDFTRSLTEVDFETRLMGYQRVISLLMLQALSYLNRAETESFEQVIDLHKEVREMMEDQMTHFCEYEHEVLKLVNQQTSVRHWQ